LPNFIVAIVEAAAEDPHSQVCVLSEQPFETQFAVQVNGRDGQAQRRVGCRHVWLVPIEERIGSGRTIVVQRLVDPQLEEASRFRVYLGVTS
jgi:hypothetical protein